jgi:hypothetical protein
VLTNTLEEALFNDYECYDCLIEMLWNIRSMQTSRDVLIVDSSYCSTNCNQIVEGVRLYYPDIPVINIVKETGSETIVPCKEIRASDPELHSKLIKYLRLYEVEFFARKHSL